MKKKISIIIMTVLVMIMGVSAVTQANGVDNMLNDKQKSIVTVAAFTAQGDLGKLKGALNDGLEAGLTVNETKEVLIQMYAYCGFPRSLNAVNTFMAVLEERAAKGIKDVSGSEAETMPKNLDKNQYGMLVRQKLFGRTSEAQPSGYQLFTPVLDDFLKEHLFADIFYRDNLDYLSREIATVAALAAMQGTNPQLQAHMDAAMITGLSAGQMQELITIINSKVNNERGDNAAKVFAGLMKR